MSKAHFRFASDILRRLGEELNPSPDQGILELVKNSYDADARSCIIELIETDKPGGKICITDDGEGMDSESITSGWLVLGRSIKSPQTKTRLGRTPAGSKGLGRLAALRMGSIVTLTTRPRSNTQDQYHLAINWSEFDNIDVVDEVTLEIEQTHREHNKKQGTEISIEGLRSRISRVDVKRLARALLLLADPFQDNPEGFNPVLMAPEFADLEALVKNRYFNDADYHLKAKVNNRGIAMASVIDWQGKELYSANHQVLTPLEHGAYRCPPAEFDLWAFILDSQTFSARHTSTIQEVRTWLQSFGGVHLYENGLRVSPYGNPGNDWLDMNLQRVRSPEERPSTNTSLGRVSVRDSQELLIQKTDRSGFIESEAFLELKRFAQDALDWMARRRLEEAEKRRAKERTGVPSQSIRAKQTIKDAIHKVPKRSRPSIEEAFEKYDRVRDKEAKTLRNEVQLYRTLSTAGITAATFAHESSGNPLKVITHAINVIERRGQERLGDDYSLTLKEPVGMIQKSTDALKVLGKVTLSMLDHEKRRFGRVDLHPTISNVVTAFKPFLDEREVIVTLDFDTGNPFLRGSEAAIEAIVANLINNSLIWLEGIQRERKIVIRTKLDGNVIRISIVDTGPGIENIDKDDIWLPGQTTRKNGTGLGLTIVRDTVEDLSGSVDAVEHSELGGAEIIIALPIIGA